MKNDNEKEPLDFIGDQQGVTYYEIERTTIKKGKTTYLSNSAHYEIQVIYYFLERDISQNKEKLPIYSYKEKKIGIIDDCANFYFKYHNDHKLHYLFNS